MTNIPALVRISLPCPGRPPFNATAAGANVPGDVADFPLLIRLDPSRMGFAEADSLGRDLRFADADGTHLPFLIERWEPPQDGDFAVFTARIRDPEAGRAGSGAEASESAFRTRFLAGELPPVGPIPTLYFVSHQPSLEPMEELLRDKVCLLRERIKSSQDDKALYRELSDLLLRAGKISAAMNILEKSLDLGSDGEAPERTTQEGKWLFDRGLEFADAYLYEDAVECFRQAMEAGHDTFDAHYCLAGVYKSLDRMQDAETHCRRTLELNPRFAPAYILLGAVLKQPGRLEESVAACKKALLLDPDCTAAYYDLACYYSLLGKREQALAAMEMALCKGFCDFDWVLRDPDLETLRQSPEFLFLLQSYRPKTA